MKFATQISPLPNLINPVRSLLSFCQFFFFQAIFCGGRTETLRPGTLETRACTEAFNSGKTFEAAELLSLMRNCSKTHQQLTKNAAQGINIISVK